MAIASLGGAPGIGIGFAGRHGVPHIQALGSGTTVDAANEAHISIGQLCWADGGSHTLDTSGSSSIQWRTGSVTFANAGTTLKVGLAAVDAANGPTPRAVNASNVITFDVAAVFTGGAGGVTTSAWQTSVPTTGSKTIAHMDLVAFAIQMTARAGVDSVVVQQEVANFITGWPSATSYISSSYGGNGYLPNVIVVASDGTLGWIYGGYVATTGSTTQTWNSGSATKEYGNILRFPVPVRVCGVVTGLQFTSGSGDCDFVLYSDPLGTPVAQRTISVDANTVGNLIANTISFYMFSSPYELAANTDYAVIAKPAATNVSMLYKTFNAAAHQACEALGTNCYAINRASGAFAAQNSSKDRFSLGILLDGCEHGVAPTYGLGV